MRVFVHIRTEDDMDLFMRETAERATHDRPYHRFFREKARLLAVLDDAGMRLRFVTTLFLFGLASLGTLAVGGREMALCALVACLMLLSAAMELGYEPICAGIRQRYLFAVGLRMLALAAPLADYFRAVYRGRRNEQRRAAKHDAGDDWRTSGVVLRAHLI